MGYGHDDGPSRLSRYLQRLEDSAEAREVQKGRDAAEARVSQGLSDLGRLIINVAASRLSDWRKEAASNEQKEWTAAEAYKSPALGYAGVLKEILQKFGGYTLHGEIHTSDLGLLYLSEDGRTMSLAGGDVGRKEKLRRFAAGLPTGGSRHPGTPTDKSVADVAGETATRVGGSFHEARDGEDFGEIVYRPVVTALSGVRIEFPVGTRPAHERPWLRGGTVLVDGSRVALADFWNSLKG